MSGAPEIVSSGELPLETGAHPRRMLDRYEILAEIAQGGMGTVYLARLGGAGGFERLFAIKLMHEHLAREETFVAMLLDEARTAAHIHHPNAVGIIDVAESPVGHYLVMSYVDGFSLAQLLDHPDVDPRDRIRVATRLIADAAHGLHAAHTAKNAKGERLGIVHRDVSPQNILVGTDGMGRIVDFGIALAASRIVSSRPGMLKGKPSYMAPEQARGEPCDARADVFALGIVLWEAVTGRRLFYAEMDIATLVKVMECLVDPPTKHVPDLPEPFSAMILTALRREPGERYQTARDFAVALERAAESAGLLATAHEVEEVVARVFAVDIETRQRAITERLAESIGAPQPLDRAGLATISRLIPRPQRDPTGPVSGSYPDQPATRASRPGADLRSGVRASAVPRAAVGGSQPIVVQPGVDAHAHTTLSDRPSAAAPAPREGRAPSKGLIGAAVLVALVAIAGTLALVFGGRGAEAEVVTETEAETEAVAETESGAGAEAESGAVAETETETETEAVAETESGAEAETETETETESVAEAEAGAATAAVAGRAAETEAVAETDSEADAPAAPRGTTRRERTTTRRTAQPAAGQEPPARSAPQLEANPYLTH